MQERHQNKEKYFAEQVTTTRDFVIPFLERLVRIDGSVSVLEVGCGEGGNLAPFLDRGCRVTGIDLSESKIEHAQKFLGAHPGAPRLRLVASDIYLAENKLGGPFDLVFLRDVIEHIHDQEKFMAFARVFLKDDGLFFFAFPPWYNPFGGHQQICKNKLLSKLPYFHLLPSPLYRFVLKAGGEDRQKITELLEIKQTGISIERFRRIANRTGYTILDETFYLVNPNYQVKFGLKPRRQNRLVAAIPFVRNLFTTTCYYILQKK